MVNMKRSLLVLSIVLVMVLSLSILAFADNPVSEARNGVAVLATMEKGDDSLNFVGWGTCFFIGKEGENPKYMLTNYHVVETYLRYGAGATRTYTIDGKSFTSKMILRVYFGSGDYEEAYVVASDEAQDVALLRLGAPTEKRVSLPLEVASDDLIGKQIYAIGFPSYADVVDATSSWSVRDALVTNGSISRYVTTSGTGAQWIQVAATEWGSGNSGGPLVTEHGSVIGLVSHSQTDFANTIYMGVHVESTFPMLRNNGIEYDLYEDRVKDETEEPEEPTPVETVAPTQAPIATVAPVNVEPVPTQESAPVIATQTPAITSAARTPDADADVKNGFKLETWMIVAAAAAVILIVILIVVATRKKPSVGGSAAVSNQSRKTGKTRTGYIRSLAAQHGGLRIPVGKDAVVIGRQESCAIRFQANTPGVSGVHCSVSFDAANNEFILTDLKSSFGTFLETGQKLTPHTPVRLRSGDSFYAGDRRNILRVESNEQ